MYYTIETLRNKGKLYQMQYATPIQMDQQNMHTSVTKQTRGQNILENCNAMPKGVNSQKTIKQNADFEDFHRKKEQNQRELH